MSRFWQTRQPVKTFWSTATRTALAITTLRLRCLAFYCRRKTKFKFSCAHFSSCWSLYLDWSMWTSLMTKTKTRVEFYLKTRESTVLRSTRTWYSRMCLLSSQSRSSSKHWRPTLRRNSTYCASSKTMRESPSFFLRPSQGSPLAKTWSHCSWFSAICSEIKSLKTQSSRSRSLSLESWHHSKSTACMKCHLSCKRWTNRVKVWKRFLGRFMRQSYSSNNTSSKVCGRAMTPYFNYLILHLKLSRVTGD